MSDTCIVCLGDLGENASVQPLPEDQLLEGDEKHVPVTISESDVSTSRSPAFLSKSSEPESELIAHLLPCGHHLHDECLKPWVERANSCPICRQKFNQVELMMKIDGPVISSYPVKDRTQVAELDPSMLIEEEDEPEDSPCRICGRDDNEEILLVCDGCSLLYHTHCVNLTSVPSGPWFCEDCEIGRAIEASLAGESSLSVPPALPAPSAGRRTRAQLRRRRNTVLARASDWARIWEQVYHRTNLDLDFPFQDVNHNVDRRTNRNRIWERRLRVAEEQGGAEQFREIVPPLLEEPTVSRPRPEPEEPETLEEVIAWNALEKARDIQHDPSARGQKRKSTTNSPRADGPSRKRRRTDSVSTPPKSPPARTEPAQRKRPRTRRVNEFVEPASDAGESSAHRTTVPVGAGGANGAGPSFLSSLLKEVENSAPADEDDPPRGRPSLSIRANLDHASPQASSPEASPTSSNLPSPRGSPSPPPGTRYRPGSPTLTSRIEPIYPRLGPDMSPISPDSTTSRPILKPQSRVDSESRTRQWVNGRGASSPERAPDVSPTRANMPLSTKEKIQRVVREALKEPYDANKINSDQYTDINRRISRLLYDRIGEGGDVDGDQASEWKQIAGQEVSKAVTALLPSPLA